MNVFVYSTERCSFCIKLKDWLKANNIPYVNKDIEEEQEALKEFQDLKAQGTPLIIVKNEAGEIATKVLGFNKQKLMKELNIS
jgi:glutaredoxin